MVDCKKVQSTERGLYRRGREEVEVAGRREHLSLLWLRGM
jgi:hypothetical protein